MFKNMLFFNFRRLASRRLSFFSARDPNKSNPFTQKMQKLTGANESKTDRLFFPGALILGSLIIYGGWRVLPYSQMFPHFTISEYVNQKHHYHAIFLAPLSFQTTGHFLVYFPLVFYGLIKNSSALPTKYLVAFYLLNSILSTITVYYYEKNYKQNRMISPKCLGACTALSNLFCFLALKPQHLILGNRFAPFFLLPAIIGMYEINEFNAGYVNEITRPAHLSSMGFGLIFGMLVKRFI